MTPAKPRCLVVGGDSLLLEGLTYLLAPYFDVRLASCNVDDALSATAERLPAAAIIDLDPNGGGSAIGRRLSEVYPDVAITYLTSASDPSLPSGAVSKNQSAADLLRALRLEPEPIGSTTANQLPPGELETPTPPTALSRRKLEVLELLVRGMTMREVARILGITPRTVAFHKYMAMKANNLNSNAELMQFALKRGLLRLVETPAEFDD